MFEYLLFDIAAQPPWGNSKIFLLKDACGDFTEHANFHPVAPVTPQWGNGIIRNRDMISLFMFDINAVLRRRHACAVGGPIGPPYRCVRLAFVRPCSPVVGLVQNRHG